MAGAGRVAAAPVAVATQTAAPAAVRKPDGRPVGLGEAEPTVAIAPTVVVKTVTVVYEEVVALSVAFEEAVPTAVVGPVVALPPVGTQRAAAVQILVRIAAAAVVGAPFEVRPAVLTELVVAELPVAAAAAVPVFAAVPAGAVVTADSDCAGVAPFVTAPVFLPAAVATALSAVIGVKSAVAGDAVAVTALGRAYVVTVVFPVGFAPQVTAALRMKAVVFVGPVSSFAV